MSISIQNFVSQNHLTHLFTLITELIIPYVSMKHFVFHDSIVGVADHLIVGARARFTFGARSVLESSIRLILKILIIFCFFPKYRFQFFWWCCWSLDCGRARTFYVWRALGSRKFHQIDPKNVDDFLFLPKIQISIWLDLWCVSITRYPSSKNLRSR